VHSPAVRDCLKCHDPHVSDLKNQLLKATDGATKATNLCLQCHNTGLNVPATGSRHAALDGGCETCHITHKTGASADAEFRYHLTKASPALCTECHDPKDAQIVKAHQGQPIEKADCLTLAGSFYNPNFLSFKVEPFYNQSRANSDFQSITGASGVTASSSIFGGSEFPGSVS
jgi:predicted CXXCH cytochrome family protein